MSNEIVLDIETQNTFEEVGGYFTDKLKVSLVGVYFYETDAYESFLEPDLPALFQRLEKGGRIIGYNSIGFDMPVMNNYYSGDLLKLPQLDILREIEKALGHRIKLDDVAKATLGTQKSGHGLQAVTWWKQGNIDAIREYCLQDVKVTREVYEFGLKNGFVLFDDRMGERRAVTVDFRAPIAASQFNMTMGF
ncbi:ribonuclease H-like domain-containing protein [Candidatus Uhrbacteria bacterium]|nr:ribonuclease H-like domain-containing protein [Candidatus Uhrbacteria bacterium]